MGAKPKGCEAEVFEMFSIIVVLTPIDTPYEVNPYCTFYIFI